MGLQPCVIFGRNDFSAYHRVSAIHERNVNIVVEPALKRREQLLPSRQADAEGNGAGTARKRIGSLPIQAPGVRRAPFDQDHAGS